MSAYALLHLYTRRYLYVFICEAKIPNTNYLPVLALIFDSRTDILEKVSKFLRQKMSPLMGVHESSNHMCVCVCVRSSLWIALFALVKSSCAMETSLQYIINALYTELDISYYDRNMSVTRIMPS